MAVQGQGDGGTIYPSDAQLRAKCQPSPEAVGWNRCCRTWCNLVYTDKPTAYGCTIECDIKYPKAAGSPSPASAPAPPPARSGEPAGYVPYAGQGSSFFGSLSGCNGAYQCDIKNVGECLNELGCWAAVVFQYLLVNILGVLVLVFGLYLLIRPEADAALGYAPTPANLIRRARRAKAHG